MSHIDESVVVVRSITNAMKGQHELERYGISAYIERNRNPNSKQGCGYGLKIRGNLDLVLEILSAAGIPIAEIQKR